MKTIKSIYIDIDFVNELNVNKINLSQLINEYLKVYFNKPLTETEKTDNKNKLELETQLLESRNNSVLIKSKLDKLNEEARLKEKNKPKVIKVFQL